MDMLCCGSVGLGSKNNHVEDSVAIMDGGAHGRDPRVAITASQAQMPDLSKHPAYQEFLEHHEEECVRIHVFLIGLVSSQSHKHGALGKRRNRFGRPRVIDAIADPYVRVEAIRKLEENSHFDLASHKFSTIRNSQSPVWDSKCLIMVPREALKDGIRFQLIDDNGLRKDELLCSIDVKDLPAPTALKDSQWTRYERTLSEDNDDPRLKHTVFAFSIMVTEGSDRLVSSQEIQDMYSPETNGGHDYSEIVLEDATDTVVGDNHSVMQCWKHPDSKKAVLWILGRNDCFMHPHVAKPLFWSQGYDLFVLNYKMNGHCRKLGYVQDPHYNSHVYSGNFDTYIPDIEQSLEQIRKSKEYELVLGYAHSTGGPVLLNYLMERGDEEFDGFLFNSPFLDWGHVGGDMVEFVLKNTGFLERILGMEHDCKIGVASTPEGTDPLMYLGQEIVLSPWSAAIWSLYYFDWATRPLYKVPMTVGFAKGVTAVHRKMERVKNENRPITAKPFLCITSRADDVLKAPDTLSRADWIGPARWEMELNDNGHDIFLSYDYQDTEMAIDLCLSWLKNRKFV